ncbi:hypothetical protein [Undibacterium sp. Ren11W]|uniref:hypothetical protein n=1 Tax=Undibacterium sp. Ren11W TaxID=3413045 RepID=UPI003BF133AB
MTNINILLSVINVIAKDVPAAASQLGTLREKIAAGIEKYDTNISGFKHFIVFSSNGKPTEFSFTLNETIDIADIEKKFGSVSGNYIFRDNITEFSYHNTTPSPIAFSFIKDNKFEKNLDGSFIETTPSGQAKIHTNLLFDCFSIKVI